MARKSRNDKQLASITHTNEPSNPAQDQLPMARYHAAIYARLSVFDLGRDKSDTMENQIEMLQRYISQQPDLTLAGIYVDNGWTGTNFSRPEFQRMMEDAKRGRINCIVVKDFSRFGRNYVETGYYVQDFFPAYQLRFISVNDGYDSLTSDPESMTISMKNIVNDYYSKDISRKVATSLDVKRMSGMHNWGHPPYGYIRHPDNPAEWIIDTETEPFVRMIFHWALEGIPLKEIARKITEVGAPTYQRLVYLRSNGKARRRGSDAWTASTVRFMITNRAYTGDYVYNKSYSRKYDPSHARRIPETEWIIIPNAHQPYISHDDFSVICDRLERKKDRYLQSKIDRENLRSAYPDRYQGILLCGECQRRMRVRRDFDQSLYMAYSCPGRKDQYHPGHAHFTINAKLLDEIIRQQLNLQIRLAVDAQTFLNRPSLQRDVQRLRLQYKADIRDLSTKLEQIKNGRSKAYENLVDGISNMDTYQMQLERLADDQESITRQIQALQTQLELTDEVFSIPNQWLRSLTAEGAVHEITTDLIHQLIEKIEVFPDKSINITYRYEDYMRPLLNSIDKLKMIDTEFM